MPAGGGEEYEEGEGGDVLWVRVKAMNMEHWTDQSPWSRTKRTMIEAVDGGRGANGQRAQ